MLAMPSEITAPIQWTANYTLMHGLLAVPAILPQTEVVLRDFDTVVAELA